MTTQRQLVVRSVFQHVFVDHVDGGMAVGLFAVHPENGMAVGSNCFFSWWRFCCFGCSCTCILTASLTVFFSYISLVGRLEN